MKKFLINPPDPFTDEIEKREDTKFFYLMKENREGVKKEMIKLLEAKQLNFL